MIDELLLKKAIRGDKECFIKLLEPIKESLYKVAFMYLKNEDDALDCIQESIIKAIQSLSSLKEPQYFNTWITRITINTCKDYIKKSNKVVSVDIKDYENKLVAENEEFDDMEDIQRALEKLSDKERELIVMRYLKDMSLKDISTTIDMPVGAVKSRLSRSLKRLKVHMEAR
ncbi:RNA polymerase, sigma-24 subunit, ECF subfamily [Clostridium bornimense]|uniref:RNA polymerase, sigma-24 subunit, ECF subfamily n=1 Tax=Clostridium bornimense TaxID=1216932 RepID=W6SJK0_9CLOT|nr:sigma-70 family RNA polymerase sigma factor [Clostridium bornimense]CDM69880.1 RNA polymerase, sigma-24 subunit, ECF subfamily [Clostridium bornimense]